MATRINGKDIAAELKRQLQERLSTREKLTLTVFVLVSDMATEKFIALKSRFAQAIGVAVTVVRLPETTSTRALVERLEAAAATCDGIIVQFPLPEHIDRTAVRNAIPVTHDVDVISDVALERFEAGAAAVLPPVVGALREILVHASVSLKGRRVVVVGQGQLVGKPAATWARQEGAHVTAVNEHTPSIAAAVAGADILILGAGSPGLITPDMLPEGVVLLDAGTSEAGGKLAGDADPAGYARTSLYTPVPGGVGPVTVAMIFMNLLTLAGLATVRKDVH